MRCSLKSRASAFVGFTLLINACALWVQAFFYHGQIANAAEQQLDDKIIAVDRYDSLRTNEDDHILSLWGIINPYIDDRRAGQNQAINQRLEQLLLHPDYREISIFLAEKQPDHQGRQLVHVAIDGQYVVETLLAEGLALYWPTDEGQMSAELDQVYRKAELEARLKKIGLWQQPDGLLICAEDALALRGKPALVMGKVHSVSQSGSRMFVNFSDNWDEDFTLLIESAGTRRAVGAMSLEAGDHVMVRGWIEQWRGPFLKLSDARRLIKINNDKEASNQCTGAK